MVSTSFWVWLFQIWKLSVVLVISQLLLCCQHLSNSELPSQLTSKISRLLPCSAETIKNYVTSWKIIHFKRFDASFNARTWLKNFYHWPNNELLWAIFVVFHLNWLLDGDYLPLINEGCRVCWWSVFVQILQTLVWNESLNKQIRIYTQKWEIEIKVQN